MVAFLSILIGALMTELSSAFLVSNTLDGRMQREATDSSAVELGLYQLANSAVPPVCVRDSRGPWFVASLNGSPAAVTQSCTSIVPDSNNALAAGSFRVNGYHEVTAVHNGYVVGDQSGIVRSYPFGSTVAEWSIATGAPVTGTPFALPDPGDYPDIGLAVPSASTTTACGGHCVLLYNQRATGTPPFACALAADGQVTGQPAGEVAPTGTTPYFPGFIFFGDAAGSFLVMDGASDGTCTEEAAVDSLGGSVVGQPLVYTGTTTKHAGTTTRTAEIFALVTSTTATWVQELQYSETTSSSGTTRALVAVSPTTGVPVGGQAGESGPSAAPPPMGGTVRFAVVGATGQIATMRISVTSSPQGPEYTVGNGSTNAVGGPVVAAPYWCPCPGGDAIGVGSTNGSFFMYDTNLNLTHRFRGTAAIRTTPAADANGDWYFGADDGNVYDVEVPATGMPMFNAAVFPGGGMVLSSPIEAGCGTELCVYFGSTAQSSMVRIGTIRIIDLQACVTSAPSTVSCSASPRLWARARIGPAGISVVGWSYYSP